MAKHKVGLIFGKFYPLHCGHIYLIEKAISQVDELHIFLGCEASRDKQLFDKSHLPKQPQISNRFSWLKETFKDRHNIHIHVLDEAGIEFYPNGWQDWSDRVKQILAEHKIIPNVVFTSEPQDVKNHEHYFGCSVAIVDADRHFMNISATQIRENPYKNWSFIAQAARPFFVKKVAIIGRGRFCELPIQLANIYNTQYVPNGYINYIEREISTRHNYLSECDYIKIAMLHVERLTKAVETANKLIFTSIDFETLAQYYSQIFEKENDVLQALKNSYQFDLVIHEKDLKPQRSQLEYFETVSKKVEALLI
ncbi:multifunctional transcriptional regulator/nicotinamide-nucleotide adenylyltransferase/ribosylnicotinamide kinase NadR [Gilliamella sp. Pas-s95]|uniref:multifunctional transcriptional regulator/nicotinamide-nucleotide adenylyltransferase/ribosylnicotinamide kinase NadR n=1 Tax=Gilliamella sp. Pas-s95 TaxID=2687317 RepID=UPI00132B5EC9|nr:multifunctional transcriptional regulator/nicotinamide-nucleotide adenylyltransferase/ribosylnicotinamide kinase NadR [Gilliamella sp. Pas-s95]MWN06092.1 multifunctional transcriptional regulator/nicotinamide-nucleotide adenylyltransferase/ribosylnicotinamide kinase NadR [Gilliamella sp. Pas-s95]